MIIGRHVCIETDYFSLAVEEGGFRPGHELACWIAGELRSRGEEPGDVMAEDWKSPWLARASGNKPKNKRPGSAPLSSPRPRTSSG